MARNLISVDQVVNDFVLSIDGDDYVNNASDTIIRNYALRGIREMGFDLLARVRSLKLSVESNNTITLPDDFVDYVKIGVVGTDGIVRAFGENTNINYSQKYVLDDAGDPVDEDNDGLFEREDSKTGQLDINNENNIVFNNYIYQGNVGKIYGLGGGHMTGEFRINYDQNRIEVSSNVGSEVVIEYVADEALSTNPTVHKYAEEALRAYIYYKLVSRKSNVPASEKARARAEWFNERRLANARLKPFTKTEALRTIRRNFKQSPKY
jgi:hypothetical protein